jgi:glycosyltransferase involved in cell wall biosynthesis
MNVAIVCDWLTSPGGAEKVVFELHTIFPDAPIYTSIYNPEKFPEFANADIRTSFLQNLPKAQKKHQWYLPMMPIAFENFDLSEYDVVISSSHSCAKGIITRPETIHISYCHSPPRYLWDNSHEYIKEYGMNKVVKKFSSRILHKLRIWDRTAAERVDHYIANSKHVKKRIAKYYQRDAHVIYPPVDIRRFRKRKDKKTFFLAVGRLTAYKKFELLVDTFNELEDSLVIVGNGEERKRLEKKANQNIAFFGYVTDEKLRTLLQDAQALIFPQLEDFGIVPLEAMACGTPVIAYDAGGAQETVIDGETGILFKKQTVSRLKQAIEKFPTIEFDHKIIRAQAEKFSQKTFRDTIKKFIESVHA